MARSARYSYASSASAAPRSDTAHITGRPKVGHSSVTFRLKATGAGTAYAYVWDGKILGQREVSIGRAGTYQVTVPGDRGTLAVAFEAAAGGTASSTSPLR